MLWETHTYEAEDFQSGETRGYGSNCREGQVVSGSIALEEPIPATPTLLRPVQGFSVFENRKGAAGRWDFSVVNTGSARTIAVTVSIMCFTGHVTEYFYD